MRFGPEAITKHAKKGDYALLAMTWYRRCSADQVNVLAELAAWVRSLVISMTLNALLTVPVLRI
jgi:hypothetical protein